MVIDVGLELLVGLRVCVKEVAMEDSFLDYLLKQGPIVAILGAAAIILFRRSEGLMKKINDNYEARIHDILENSNKRIQDIMSNSNVMIDQINTANRELLKEQEVKNQKIIELLITHHTDNIKMITESVGSLGKMMAEQASALKDLSDIVIDIKAKVEMLHKAQLKRG